MKFIKAFLVLAILLTTFSSSVLIASEDTKDKQVRAEKAGKTNNTSLSLVPWPKEIHHNKKDGYVSLKTGTVIFYDTRSQSRLLEGSLKPLAKVLAEEIEILTGIKTPIKKLGKRKPDANDIVLRFAPIIGDFAKSEDQEDQSYQLKISKAGVEIKSQYYKGVCYGTATLLQLLLEKSGRYGLPCLEIKDAPISAYRGVMIDVARKPHSITVLKSVVRLASLFKVRYMHLHLTDGQSFTFPFKPITDNLSEKNYAYTIKELEDLVAYADVRGVTIIPELEVPGHSGKIIKSGYLPGAKGDRDVASPKNYEKINEIVDAMLAVFKSTPYFHMGGDESSAGGALVGLVESINKHLRGNPVGGKRRLLVWEGFHGNPTDKIPPKGDDRVIVLSWESLYNAPWTLLKGGYELINASWAPTYILSGYGSVVGNGNNFGKMWTEQDLYNWNKDTFTHWQPGVPVFEDKGPKDPDRNDHMWHAKYIDKEDQVIGGQMQFWEQKEQTVMHCLTRRLPVLASQLWNPNPVSTYAGFKKGYDIALEKVLPIIEPVEILLSNPLTGDKQSEVGLMYTPYAGSSSKVELINRTKIKGEIHYEFVKFNAINDSSYGVPSFHKTLSAPTSSSKTYNSPLTESGAFGIRARLYSNSGELIGGDTWGFFANYKNRIKVTEYDIVGSRKSISVPDFNAYPANAVLREYESPMLRGPFRHIKMIGQRFLADFTPPGSGKYTFDIRTQSGHASLYLDLNRNGKWEANEKIITDSPSNESPVSSAAVALEKGVQYPFRLDHKAKMIRPRMLVEAKGPGIKGSNGRGSDATAFLTLPKKK